MGIQGIDPAAINQPYYSNATPVNEQSAPVDNSSSERSSESDRSSEPHLVDVVV